MFESLPLNCLRLVGGEGIPDFDINIKDSSQNLVPPPPSFFKLIFNIFNFVRITI